MLEHDLPLKTLSLLSLGSFRTIHGASQNTLLPGLPLSARSCPTLAGLDPQTAGLRLAVCNGWCLDIKALCVSW